MSAHPSEPSPYAEMLALAERQVVLARAGDIAAMEPLWREWDELSQRTPAVPPAGAAPLLQRMAALNERVSVALDRLHETLMRDVALTARAGRAARGYAPPGRRPPLIDRTI